MKAEAGNMLPPDPANRALQSARWRADLERAWLEVFAQHHGSTTQEHAPGDEPGVPGMIDTAEAASATGKAMARDQNPSPDKAPTERSMTEESCDSMRIAAASGDAEEVPMSQRPSAECAIASCGRVDSTQGLGSVFVVDAAIANWVESPATRVSAGALGAPDFPANVTNQWVTSQGITQANMRGPDAAHIFASTLGATQVDAQEPGAATSSRPMRDFELRSFARRLLQVVDGAELQLNLRDAAVQGAQQEVVANALFQQLHAAGIPLRRIYVNGERYESALVINAPLPIPTSHRQVR